MKHRRLSEGFTVVEVLVVLGITMLITGFLIVNFSRSRTDMNQVTVIVAAAVREAQSLALSGSTIRVGNQDVYPCGYGITFTASNYTVYSGPDSSGGTNCSVLNRNFGGGDSPVRVGQLPSSVELNPLPADIFFEPPNPTTFINNSSAPGGQTVITIRRIGATCPGVDCRTVTVTTAGSIQTQ